jgi:hypothetical protein
MQKLRFCKTTSQQSYSDGANAMGIKIPTKERNKDKEDGTHQRVLSSLPLLISFPVVFALALKGLERELL